MATERWKTPEIRLKTKKTQRCKMCWKKRQQNINGISNKETLGKEIMNNKAKKKQEKDYGE